MTLLGLTRKPGTGTGPGQPSAAGAAAGPLGHCGCRQACRAAWQRLPGSPNFRVGTADYARLGPAGVRRTAASDPTGARGRGTQTSSSAPGPGPAGQGKEPVAIMNAAGGRIHGPWHAPGQR